MALRLRLESQDKKLPVSYLFEQMVDQPHLVSLWPGFDSRHYQKRKSSGSGTGSTQPREYN
jgi:hypothetical protein